MTSFGVDSAAIDRLNRIILGGKGLVARLTADGTPDPTFGSDGRTEERPGPQRTDYSFDVAIQHGSAIVASFEGEWKEGSGNPDIPVPGSIGIGRFLAKAPHRCAGHQATIVGRKKGETLRGTRDRDVIVGLGGADRILGGGGADIICGGRGADILRGGKGADMLRGGKGRDRLYGGPGQDLLDGGPSIDLLKQGGGRAVWG